MKTIVSISPFLIIGIATWLTFANKWIAVDINLWQANFLNSHKYYPFLTISILALPPLIVFAIIKKLLTKKSTK